MTRYPGQPLVSWLSERSAAHQQQADQLPRPVHQSPQQEVHAYCESFRGAVRFSGEMVSQLGPTLGRLNRTIAYHRDVCARNILVDADCPPATSSTSPGFAQDEAVGFALVDFGLAVDARAWHLGGNIAGSWEEENPTGDARYWGPASWVRFLSGAHVLAQDEFLLRAYTCRLDLFALAICAMEAIHGLHCCEFPAEACMRLSQPLYSEADYGDQDGGREASVILFKARLATLVQRFGSSWSAYWTEAVHSFKRLAEYSRLSCLGDQQGAGVIWQELITSRIPENLSDRLKALRDDLSRVLEHCRVPVDDEFRDMQIALGALREMLHESSLEDWEDIVERLATLNSKTNGATVPFSDSRGGTEERNWKPSKLGTFAAATAAAEDAYNGSRSYSQQHHTTQDVKDERHDLQQLQDMKLFMEDLRTLSRWYKQTEASFDAISGRKEALPKPVPI
eukprot:TRINITY_DN17883_c0_g1_i1.p1 TRINITY_DN17883_c0_g1~~TRINITY_DN17883_c0_g1_i1.p1  ORF type:complete len:452 (-),score=73.50 TRINITY_DN17883_c0_g1_i1:314-1669(-)